MNWIKKLGIRLGWKKINKAAVNKWVNARNVPMLVFTLQKGLYRQRMQAIQGLRLLGVKTEIPRLLLIARTDIEPVAQVALETIRYLDEASQHQESVTQLEDYWENRRKAIAAYQPKPRPKRVNKKERMRNLERVRQQLKRPMR